MGFNDMYKKMIDKIGYGVGFETQKLIPYESLFTEQHENKMLLYISEQAKSYGFYDCLYDPTYTYIVYETQEEAMAFYSNIKQNISYCIYKGEIKYRMPIIERKEFDA